MLYIVSQILAFAHFATLWHSRKLASMRSVGQAVSQLVFIHSSRQTGRQAPFHPRSQVSQAYLYIVLKQRQMTVTCFTVKVHFLKAHNNEDVHNTLNPLCSCFACGIVITCMLLTYFEQLLNKCLQKS